MRVPSLVLSFFFLLILVSIVLSSPAFARTVLSSESVTATTLDLQKVSPPVYTPVGAEDLLSPLSCLGDFGPLSAYGPLSFLGPLGKNLWNVSELFEKLPEWSAFSHFLALKGGPLSDDGPLGPKGPLSDKAYYQTLPSINDFGKQLQLGGVWTVLGPLGPLGALGPLGPLGPIGAHGFKQTAKGYTKQNKIFRKVQVPFERTKRTFELFEIYSESVAKKMSDNDTSFLVLAQIQGVEVDSYSFTSASSQWVTVVVVPEKQLDHFSVALKNSKGELIAKAQSLLFINWIQMEVKAGETFHAEVELLQSRQIFTKDYRLIVVGSSPYFQSTDIHGPHQLQTN